MWSFKMMLLSFKLDIQIAIFQSKDVKTSSDCLPYDLHKSTSRQRFDGKW